MRYTPMTTDKHARVGTRERLLDIQRRYPDRLKIELDALATRVLFDDGNRAVGVEYLKGERLYRAHAKPNAAAGDVRQARASREVILAGGAFNTPQLLMLSGIGPRADARSAEDSGARRRSRGRPEPAGSLRGRHRQPHVLRCVGSAARRDVHEKRSAVRRVVEGQERRLHDQRRGAVGHRAIHRRTAGAGSVLLRPDWPLRGLLSRLLDARRRRTRTA